MSDDRKIDALITEHKWIKHRAHAADARAAEWEARYQTLAGLVAPLIDVAHAADGLSQNVNEFGDVTDDVFWEELHRCVDRLRTVGGLPILDGKPALLAVPLPLGDPDDDPGLRVAPL